MRPVPQFFFELDPPSPFSSLQSPFFRLPLELREKIYHYLWLGKRYFSYNDASFGFLLEYGEYTHDADHESSNHFEPNPFYDGNLVPWLFTCKQLLAEMMVQFYRVARCTGFVTREMAKTSAEAEERFIPPSEFRLLNVRRVTKISNGTPLYNEHVCKLEVITDYEGSGNLGVVREKRKYGTMRWRREEQNMEVKKIDLEDLVPLGKYGDTKTLGLIVPDYWNDSRFDERQSFCQFACLVACLEHSSHSIKDLTLSFQFPELPDKYQYYLGFDGDTYSKTWHVDMSFLEKLSCTFERVEFKLYFPTTAQSEIPWERDIFAKLRQEFARVAKVLVGENEGNIWILRDWVDPEPQPPLDGVWGLEVRRINKGPSRGEITYQG